MAAFLHLSTGHGLLLLAILPAGAAALLLTWVRRGRDSWARYRTRARAGLSATSFARLMEGHGFDSGVALATYCYLQEVQGARAIILPTQQLDRDFGLSPDQVEQTLLALMGLLGRKPALEWCRQPVITVEDLMAVLQNMPRQVGKTAA